MRLVGIRDSREVVRAMRLLYPDVGCGCSTRTWKVQSAPRLANKARSSSDFESKRQRECYRCECHCFYEFERCAALQLLRVGCRNSGWSYGIVQNPGAEFR
jgi:hypothetical protein